MSGIELMYSFQKAGDALGWYTAPASCPWQEWTACKDSSKCVRVFIKHFLTCTTEKMSFITLQSDGTINNNQTKSNTEITDYWAMSYKYEAWLRDTQLHTFRETGHSQRHILDHGLSINAVCRACTIHSFYLSTCSKTTRQTHLIIHPS